MLTHGRATAAGDIDTAGRDVMACAIDVKIAAVDFNAAAIDVNTAANDVMTGSIDVNTATIDVMTCINDVITAAIDVNGCIKRAKPGVKRVFLSKNKSYWRVGGGTGILKGYNPPAQGCWVEIAQPFKAGLTA